MKILSSKNVFDAALEAGLIRLEAPAPVLRLGSDSEIYRQSEKEVACPHCGESMYIAEIK